MQQQQLIDFYLAFHHSPQLPNHLESSLHLAGEPEADAYLLKSRNHIWCAHQGNIKPPNKALLQQNRHHLSLPLQRSPEDFMVRIYREVLPIQRHNEHFSSKISKDAYMTHSISRESSSASGELTTCKYSGPFCKHKTQTPF